MIELKTSRRHPVRLLAATAAALALGLSACGGEDDDDPASGGEGPAALVPADAPVYIESAIRPEGEARETIDRLYESVTGESDAGAALIEEINSSAEEDGTDLTYEDDIAPWLGERAAFFFGDTQSLIESEGEVSIGDAADAVEPGCLPPEAPDGGPLDGVDSISPEDEACAQPEPEVSAEDVAVIVETTDEDAANEALDKAADLAAGEEGAEVSDGSYEGVDYLTIDEGEENPSQIGIVDGFLVLGDQAGFESVVDTAGGDSLADVAEVTDGISELSDEPFFSAYVDAPTIFEQVESTIDLSTEDQAALDLYRGYLERPVFFTGEIDSDGIELASSTGTLGATLTEAGLLDDLPAGSLAAFGIPDLGDYFNTFIDQLRSNPEFESQFDTASAQFEREVGLPLEDAIGNIGDLRGFVRGESVLSLDGAVTIDVESQGPLVEFIDGLRASAKSDGERVEDVNGLPGAADARGFAVTPEGAPQQVYIVQNGSTLVIAYGEEAVGEAVAPSAPLGDDETYADAVEDIDDVDPNFYVDMAPIQALVASVPVTPEEFSADQAAAILGEFEYLIGGARTDGDTDITRYRLGLTGD